MVTLDGQVLPRGVGSRELQVSAGEHVLTAPSLVSDHRKAEHRFRLEPGQRLELWYAPPVQQLYFDGRFGTSPQPPPGLRMVTVLFVAYLVVGLLVTYLR